MKCYVNSRIVIVVKNGDRNISKDSQEKVYENNLGENQGNENLKRIFDPRLRESIHLFPLLTVNFIGTVGFSIVLSFMVFLVNKTGGNSFIYGLANSIYPIFQLIDAPILGRWSDILWAQKDFSLEPVWDPALMDYLSFSSLSSYRNSL